MSWAGRRVLLTGHTGFKGAWLLRWLQRAGAEVTGLSLAPEHPDGTYAVLAPWDVDEVEVDIRDREATVAAIARARPEVVLHLAAQALVRRSYEQPSETYATNVVGTANVLEGADAAGAGAVLVVTSDKVYRQDGGDRPFVESDPLGGADPYSASKACTELVVAAFAHRHPDVRVATARAGNVIGGGDRGVDRLIPDLVRAAESGVAASIRFPGATRPWQHVLDPISGYVLLAERLADGEPVPAALNLGPDRASEPVASIVERFLADLGRGSWSTDGGDHPHEAATLTLDASLAHDTLGWRPRLDLATSLSWTAEWYRTQLDGGDLRAVTDAQLARYEELA